LPELRHIGGRRHQKAANPPQGTASGQARIALAPPEAMDEGLFDDCLVTTW